MIFTPTHELLLTRSGLIFVAPGGEGASEAQVQAVELELAALGYVASSRLRARFATLSLAELTALRAWMLATLAAALGADQKHEPLFSRFPEGVPSDTAELWWRKVLVHFVQQEGQACLFCGQRGTTHVLQPCRHVVCDHCFDGSNYTACPACERSVDRSSPFFVPPPAPRVADPQEAVTFKRLDLGENVDETARALWVSFCARKQVMSPDDVGAFSTITGQLGEGLLSHLPELIPVKENVALAFGTLLHVCPTTSLVMEAARPYLKTATDVLRLIAVHSGADPSLAPRDQNLASNQIMQPGRWWGKAATSLAHLETTSKVGTLTIKSRRFKLASLRRPLRRALLAILESFSEENLFTDLLRYQSSWAWVGEFLHPHEFARRFPNVARGFALVRAKAPDGTPAPPFANHASRVEAALHQRDIPALVGLLRPRPGELARRLDHALRRAGDEGPLVVEAFLGVLSGCSTPVLLTLRSVLPTRARRAPVRIYWPKGAVARGISQPDERAELLPEHIAPLVEGIDQELLRRFALSRPGSPTDFLLDEALGEIIVPFNERTASPAAISLPRGSRVKVPEGKVARLFLHWCEPEKDGQSTDLDLSVGFYSDTWEYRGVCSYYQLKWEAAGVEIATSAGDLRDAPYPDGASEFVDIHREEARQAGCRWAVMVVTSYSGMPFDKLERSFAGLMLRERTQGLHFDPRTVELRFSLQGKNGVFLPLAFDLVEGTLHWLDTYSQGALELNNVANSNRAITRISRELIGYFGSGIRLSMLDLARLHAAARATRVFVRGATTSLFVRQPSESPSDFLARLRRGAADEPEATPPADTPVSAFLLRGDLPLAPGSVAYALFREQLTGTLAASDLLA